MCYYLKWGDKQSMTKGGAPNIHKAHTGSPVFSDGCATQLRLHAMWFLRTLPTAEPSREMAPQRTYGDFWQLNWDARYASGPVEASCSKPAQEHLNCVRQLASPEYQTVGMSRSDHPQCFSPRQIVDEDAVYRKKSAHHIQWIEKVNSRKQFHRSKWYRSTPRNKRNRNARWQ